MISYECHDMLFTKLRSRTIGDLQDVFWLLGI